MLRQDLSLRKALHRATRQSRGQGIVQVPAGCAGAGSKTCCSTTFQAGYTELLKGLAMFCGCASNAPCAAQCGPNLCTGGGMASAECQTCLMSTASMSPPAACILQTVQACTGSKSCNEYFMCDNACK